MNQKIKLKSGGEQTNSLLLFFCNVKKQDSYVKISLEKRGDILYNRSVGAMGNAGEQKRANDENHNAYGKENRK